MEDVRYVTAVCLSDIHLSDKAPIARSVEPDWRAAMQRQFDEVKKIAVDYGAVPILCGGDLFDKWNPSVELVNWAIVHLPGMYAIPGQHDLFENWA